MIDYIFSAGILVQFALLFYAAGFLARDELVLRGLILIGSVFYLLYYYHISDTPLWDAMFATGVLTAINVVMIIWIIFERTTFAMSAEMTLAYESFPTLNPGQFRKIFKHSKVINCTTDTQLCTQGQDITKLYKIVYGQSEVCKDGQTYASSKPTFIGEIGFLCGQPATATVTALSGTTYMEWDVQVLRKLMNKSASLDTALVALFGLDMAKKVAVSLPRQSAST